MHPSLRRWTIFPILALLTGCSSGFQGVLHGQPMFDLGWVTIPMGVSTTPPPTSPSLNIPPVCEKAIANDSDITSRNRCIEIMMGQIDVAYYDYRKSLLAAVSGTNVATDLATIGLGAAGTLVGGATTKSILAGIVTGISGSKQVINSELLYNQSIMVVIQTMDADRDDKDKTIFKRMYPNATPASDAKVEQIVTNPTTNTQTTTTTQTTTAAAKPKATPAKLPDYTMYMAARDLQQYYEAGTYTHALITLASKAGTDLTNCRAAVKNAKTGQTTTPTDIGTGACK